MLVFDNGGGALKAGWSTDAEPIVMHNFIARSKSDKKIYVGDEVSFFFFFLFPALLA